MLGPCASITGAPLDLYTPDYTADGSPSCACTVWLGLGHGMISRFSAFWVWAAFVKVKLPVRTVLPSMIITLLWAMACSASIMVGTPWFARKSAEEYFSVRWLLSRMTWTWTPRLWASSSALAIGAEVKL